jgi:hypothetical protein
MKTFVKLGTAPLEQVQQFPTRRVFVSWAGEPHLRDVPIVPAVFKAQRHGGWLLIIQNCPFCGRRHTHGSNANPDWTAQNNTNPAVYATAPKFARCNNGRTREIYVFELVAGLPREARGGR